MKTIHLLILVLILALLTACNTSSPGISLPAIFASPTPLPTAPVQITSAPNAQEPLSTYLDALKNEDYTNMYALLTPVSKEAISLDDFAARYKDALNTMGVRTFDYEILSAFVNNPYTAQVSFRITYHTSLMGDIARDMVAHLSREGDAWKLQWDESLILPELAGGNLLAMDYQIPARGDIYDHEGNAIVNQSNAYALGIIPGQLSEETQGTLFNEMGRICGLDPQEIRDQIDISAPDWYLPFCEATEDEAERILRLGGLVATPYEARFYHLKLASQAIGYTLPIDPDQLDEYRRNGYRGDERVGQAGIEKWAEEYLAGKHGGSLYLVDPSTGQITTRLGTVNPEPAASIYLTLDSDLQYYAQQALIGFRGAVVVLERDTGRVLAMASSPSYDANLFEPGNTANNSLLTELLNNPAQPLVNRTTQGQYPLGSVFKVVTFSAGLESGLFLPETTLDCQYEWTGLTDQIRYDWTWDHCQKRLQAGQECNTSDSQPSGLLTLPEGLMRSCNPWFWQIGLDLYNFDRQNDIANMARAFGLGQPTGIEQVAEAPGQISDPPTVIDMVNQAIGQGDVQVTPLQVATMIAAIGNGGTLYRPQLIEKIQPIDGNPTVAFKPEARGTLPLRADNLELLQQALISVVNDSRGTAHYRLRGLDIPVAGKTGTAESGSGEPHAWFAGYTYANETDTTLPNIAIAVILENAGEGSDFAAPIFRRMVDVYFTGGPRALLPWEANYGIPKTPTPLGGIPTKTPKPRN